MPGVRVSGLVKRFGSLIALRGVDLDAPDKVFLTLLGPSGCGKSTFLRTVAGLEKPDEGEIEIGGDLVSSSSRGVFVPAEKRHIGMVFQSYAIWPHMKVFDNVAFPLTIRKYPKDKIREMVTKALAMVRLEGLEYRYPSQLSGGQQQRVGLARAIVFEPRVLLLDEPLSNLDARLREHMRTELKILQKELSITTIYVTHDQIEALTLSDTVAVMNTGEVLQVGTPKEVYNRPANAFVADFIGLANLIRGKVTEVGVIETSIGRIRCQPMEDMRVGDNVMLSVRPEYIRLVPADRLGENTWLGVVTSTAFMGEYLECRVTIGDTNLRIHAPNSLSLMEGDEIGLYLDPSLCIAIKPIT